MGENNEDLVKVRLIGVPVDILARSEERQQDLLREFALIDHSDHDPPAKLASLMTKVRSDFGAFTAAQRVQMDEAVAAGSVSIDLTYSIPPAAKQAALALDATFDEVDEFCRKGALLTLEAPREQVAFRRWFFGQVVAQIDGNEAVPWSTWYAGYSDN